MTPDDPQSLVPDWRLARDEQWDVPPIDLSSVGKPLSRLSWLSPRTLWRSHNDPIARFVGDPTEALRALWVGQQRRVGAVTAQAAAADADEFVIDRSDLPTSSFMVFGDSGEGDVSQYAAVPGMLAIGEQTDFAVIASDVVYPAGDANEYIDKFFVPYHDYRHPIYAVPGNHDWLDGLTGFMRHFCGVKPPTGLNRTVADTLGIGSVSLRLWRPGREPSRSTLEQAEALRGNWQRLGPPQPNMYFCIDLPQLRVVCIDTGIEGRLDHEQGQWLRAVSADPRPKLLVSGKPIYSNGAVSPRRILPSGGQGGQGGTLLEIIKDPIFNYRAVLSGDVHNYQRYPVRQADGREIQFIVCGGGGAFMTATHKIPAVDLPGVEESQFVCYPQRGDSLRAYSIVYQWLRTGQGRRRNMRSKLRRRKVTGIPADEAAVIVARRHGLPLAPELRDVVVSERSQKLAERVFGFDRRSGPWAVSELLDWDCPPLFKSFLKLTVGDGGVDVECFAVNGLPSDSDPSVIDSVRIDF